VPKDCQELNHLISDKKEALLTPVTKKENFHVWNKISVKQTWKKM